MHFPEWASSSELIQLFSSSEPSLHHCPERAGKMSIGCSISMISEKVWTAREQWRKRRRRRGGLLDSGPGQVPNNDNPWHQPWTRESIFNPFFFQKLLLKSCRGNHPLLSWCGWAHKVLWPYGCLYLPFTLWRGGKGQIDAFPKEETQQELVSQRQYCSMRQGSNFLTRILCQFPSSITYKSYFFGHLKRKHLPISTG